MNIQTARQWTVLILGLVLSPILAFESRADGVCTPRVPTAIEKTTYANSHALFLRVAPKAPDGWTASDNPKTGTMPVLCRESGSQPVRRGFNRSFQLELGRQARDERAVQAYAAQMKNQQAKAAANKAESDAIDAQVAALSAKAQKAAAAQKFAEIEPLNMQIDALMKRKSALMGYDDASTQAAAIEAEAARDTEARFSLWFEVPKNEPRTGQAYRTAAGRALVTAYDDKGNATHDVRIYFDGAPEQARVTVTGDPARVRALVDATDLRAIAAFR